MKKPLFWIVIVLALLATPSAIKIFELYIYSPQTEPAPEDFYVRSEEPPFTGFEPLPEEDVEIGSGKDEKQIVKVHKDGYQLILPASLDVSTWNMEEGIVKVFKDSCQVTIAATESKKIEEAIRRSKEYHEGYDGLTLIKYGIEKIQDTDKEAYMETYENDVFGAGYNIFIQGENRVISISQNDPYPECNLIMEVLDSFEFI